MVVGMLPMQSFAAETENSTDSTQVVSAQQNEAEETRETEAEVTEPDTVPDAEPEPSETEEATTEPDETFPEETGETTEPAAPEAGDAEDEETLPEETDDMLEPQEVEQTVSIQASFLVQWDGEFATKPLLDMTVSSDTAESYGFADQTDSATQVSTVDVLVAAHVARYGDAFTKATAGSYLVINGNFVTTLFGHDSDGNLCILVNGSMPGNDGIEQAVMKSGDILEIFQYQVLTGDWSDGTKYCDKYLYLETKDGQKLSGTTLPAGVAVELVVKGYSPFYESYGEAGKATTISGATLYMVNMQTGGLTSLNAVSAEDGTVTVTIPKDQIGATIYLTARGKETAMSLNKVTVTEPPAISQTTLSGLEVAVGGSTLEDTTALTLSPAFHGDTKAYTTPILDYEASSDKRYVWVKV